MEPLHAVWNRSVPHRTSAVPPRTAKNSFFSECMSTSALWPYMVKSLGRGTYGLGLALEGPGLGLGLGLEILALTTSLGQTTLSTVNIGLRHCRFVYVC